jgi:hypothetical protein
MKERVLADRAIETSTCTKSRLTVLDLFSQLHTKLEGKEHA